MEIFETFDQLSEISTDQFVIDVGVVVHDKVKEISIRSVLHNGVRDLLGASLGNSFSFGFNVVSSDNVGVVDERETSFIFEVSMGLVSGKTEDFHGIVLLVDLRVNQVNWELSLVEGLNDTNISENLSIFDWHLNLRRDIAESGG